MLLLAGETRGEEWGQSGSFKEMTPTAILSFCVGHESPSGYYTKVPARQKTHVQTQHRYDRRQREGEGVAVAAGRPLMMLAAFVLVRSVSRAPSATPFPSLACAGEHLQQPWDSYRALTPSPAAPQPLDHSSACSSLRPPRLPLLRPQCCAATSEGQVPKGEACLRTAMCSSGSHGRTSLTRCFHMRSHKEPRKAMAQHPEQDRAAHTVSFAPH